MTAPGVLGHEFTEDINDGSMCVCGIPALGHDEWESASLTPADRPTETDEEASTR